MNQPQLQSIPTISLTGPATVGAVRSWLAMCDKAGLSEDTELLDCVLAVDLPVATTEFIMCGEHGADEEVWDVVTMTHTCPPVTLSL